MHIEIPDVIAFSSRLTTHQAVTIPVKNKLQVRRRQGEARQSWSLMTLWLGFDSLEGILNACGYQVQTCEDPRDALSLLKQNSEQIDLVITDLQMPCLDGIELAAELRKINAALPVVLTSAAMFQMPSEKLQSFRNSRFPDQALGP